jgi:hypothetical protein
LLRQRKYFPDFLFLQFFVNCLERATDAHSSPACELEVVAGNYLKLAFIRRNWLRRKIFELEIVSAGNYLKLETTAVLPDARSTEPGLASCVHAGKFSEAL